MFKNMLNGIFKDDLKAVKDHIITDVLFPRVDGFVRETALYIINEAAVRLLYGDKAPAQVKENVSKFWKGVNGNGSSYSSTNKITTNSGNAGTTAMKQRINYSCIVADDMAEVNKIMTGLSDQIAANGYATVTELYSLYEKATGVQSTDSELGWTSLEGSGWTIYGTEGKLAISLPKPTYLKNRK